MKFLISMIFIVLAITISACVTHSDKSYYDRANKASEKSLRELDK